MFEHVIKALVNSWGIQQGFSLVDFQFQFQLVDFITMALLTSCYLFGLF